LLHQDGFQAEKWGSYLSEVCAHHLEKSQTNLLDDIVVTSQKHDDLLDDLKHTFKNLRKYKMMLNPKKCVFGV
jgi:hypothetical protein